MKTTNVLGLFLQSCHARGLSPDTIRWYKGILNAFANRYPEFPKGPEPIEEFMAQCNAGDERRHGYYRALRVLYNYAEKRLGAKNAIRLIDPPRRKPKYPRFLTPEELDQLLAYPHPPKIKAALLFLTDTGARIGELARLDLTDISETPWGYVTRITGKTGMRIVPISVEVYYALTRALPLGYSRHRLSRLVSHAFQEARIQGRAHVLRHTFGTLWHGDELALQQIMGHAYLSTTQLYRHLRTQTLSEQHHKYSPLKMVMSSSKEMSML
jgi:integrase